MKIASFDIEGPLLIKPKIFGDERGFFKETYRKSILKDQGIEVDFVQDNYSRSKKGTLRGLHYQIKDPQAKLVMVGSGSIIDIAVDIRQNSPTFGKHISVELSDKNHNMLFIPVGFAHGFCVISDQADFLYKCSDYYNPDGERGILWNDSDLSIVWPQIQPFIISEKDKTNLLLKNIKTDDLFE